MEKSSIILLVGLVAGAGLALLYTESQKHDAKPPPAVQQDNHEAPPLEDTNQPLPANHPPIGNAGMGNAMGMGGGMAPSEDEAAALEWKAPDAWKSVPNPNGMRLATYQLSPSGDTELVVSRAGGDVAGNIARWQGQFEGSPKPVQTEKTVKDIKITEVQIDGAYTNTMDPSGGAKKDWSMLAAIVQGKGRPYFFKIVGPAKTVHDAKKPFDTMLDGLTSK